MKPKSAGVPDEQPTESHNLTQDISELEGFQADPAAHLDRMASMDDGFCDRLAFARQQWRHTGVAPAPEQARLRAQCYSLLMAMIDIEDPAFNARGLRLAMNFSLLSIISGEMVPEAVWAIAHKLYRAAETSGTARKDLGAGASAEHYYVRMLLFAVLGSGSYTRRQADKIFEWFGDWSVGTLCERDFDPARHDFYVDLASTRGPRPMAVGGEAAEPRYFDHARLVEQLGHARAEYFQTICTLTLGSYASNPLFELYEGLDQVYRFWSFVEARRGGRGSDRQRVGNLDVHAAASFVDCVKACVMSGPSVVWRMTDLSPSGAGFVVPAEAGKVPKGVLVAFWAPDNARWVIGSSVRVVAGPDGQQVGVQRLAGDWRPVRLLDAKPTDFVPDPATDPRFGFFVFGDKVRGLADSLVLRARAPLRSQRHTPGRHRRRQLHGAHEPPDPARHRLGTRRHRRGEPGLKHPAAGRSAPRSPQGAAAIPTAARGRV